MYFLTVIFIDSVLLLLSTSAFIANIVIVNAPTEFDLEYKIFTYNYYYGYYYDSNKKYTYYYTLHTFFLNYSDCLQTTDPTVLISISLAILFLSMVSTCTTLRITFLGYVAELRAELKRDIGSQEEFQDMLPSDPSVV